MIKYCVKCLYPETKPDIWFDDKGVCSACLNYDDRPTVDWQEREREFLEIVERYRSKDQSNYDCIVPVSGGKDSTYQVLKLLELGLNPLAVTARTDSLSDLGKRNLENLKNIGVDHVDITPNPQVRRKISRLGLEQVGDIQWGEHITIFTLPIRVAVEKNIPLIVWGENSQHEYGGPASDAKNNTLDRRWLEEFGGLLGLRSSDLIGQSDIEKKDILPYTYPSEEDIQRVGVTGVFLGHYFEWDGFSNVLMAQANGFESYPTVVEGNYVNYENLDNYYHGIHDYFKYLKYGFGRATDQANNHIRRGRLSRAMALDSIKHLDGAYPSTYLGRELDSILAEIEMRREEFDKLCNSFTNKKIFKKNTAGNIKRRRDGSPLLINDDNESS
ncbi:MAG: N-acetyl sugar amidotransferase [Pseudohongiellaceae bacterium]|jgi:N-acetyl sugar amidotransferase